MNEMAMRSMGDAFRQARSSDANLAERLRIVAEAASIHLPDYTAALNAFVARIVKARAGDGAPAVGEVMPDFVLPDEAGHLIGLADALDEGPAVIAFHRGHWCPFCRLMMLGLTEIEERIRPARIIAISPEVRRYTRLIKAECGASFPFLTDMDSAYALSLDLAVWLDPQLSGLIAEAGHDIPLYQGGGDWIVPMPAVFVLADDGTIIDRRIDPDYRQRMELDQIVRAIDGLTRGKER